MMNNVAKTPREELECKKKYLYEYSMFWECKDGSKSQILEDDVCDLLNTQQDKITELEKNFEDLVDWSTGMSKRNVLLDEKIGRLQQENRQLREINKEIGDDLYNCRLNKKIRNEK